MVPGSIPGGPTIILLFLGAAMSTPMPTESLKALARSDAALVTLDRQLKELAKQLTEPQKRLAMLEAQKDQFQTPLSTLQKELQALELAIQGTRDFLKKKQQTLREVSAYRQQQALEREISNLEYELAQDSSTQVDLSFTIDHLKKGAADGAATFTTAHQTLTEKLATVTAEITAAQEKLAAAHAEHATLAASLPGEWAGMYAGMRKRLADPIVPVVSDACGGCFYPLQPYIITKLRHGEILACNACSRLVFLST